MKSLDLAEPLLELIEAELSDQDKPVKLPVTDIQTLAESPTFVSLDPTSWKLIKALCADIAELNETLKSNEPETKRRSIYNGFSNNS